MSHRLIVIDTARMHNEAVLVDDSIEDRDEAIQACRLHLTQQPDWVSILLHDEVHRNFFIARLANDDKPGFELIGNVEAL